MWVTVQQILNLAWIIFHSAPVDDVFDASGNSNIAVFILAGQVPAVEPAVLGKGCSVGTRIVKIARKQHGTANL